MHIFRLKKSIETKNVPNEYKFEGENFDILSYSVVNGTTLKYNSGDYSSKLKLGNSAVMMEVGCKPHNLNDAEKIL